MTITTAQLRKFAPKASQKIVDGIVANQKLLADAGITTPLRIRHFFAQIANETGGLTKLEESLSYSAKRLCQVWPSRFPTVAAAAPYAKSPEKLANKVYGGRLGNNKPGDGWNYRGSGLMQTTGKANFAEVEKETGLPVVAQPSLLRTFPGALQAAVIYWKNNGINKLADQDDIKAVTKAINGSLIGLADRKVWLAAATKVWPIRSASAKPVTLAAIPAIEPKPAPVPTPATDKEQIRRVQADLTALKYNPGGADGIMGPLTKGAILAFRSDHNLSPGDFIDSELIAALATAKPREMVPARANATTAEVAAKVPEVRTNVFSKIGAAIVAIPGAAISVGVGSLEYLGVAKSYIEPVQEAAGDVPGPVWIGLITIVAAGLYFWSRHGEKKGVEAFQAGDRR